MDWSRTLSNTEDMHAFYSIRWHCTIDISQNIIFTQKVKNIDTLFWCHYEKDPYYNHPMSFYELPKKIATTVNQYCFLIRPQIRSTKRTIFRSWFNMTYFGMKRIHLQSKLTKCYFFNSKLYSLFASQEDPKNVASETFPARIDTLRRLISLWKL